MGFKLYFYSMKYNIYNINLNIKDFRHKKGYFEHKLI